jgi:hypothetical protein
MSALPTARFWRRQLREDRTFLGHERYAVACALVQRRGRRHAVQQDFAAERRELPGDSEQRRRLAGAVRA